MTVRAQTTDQIDLSGLKNLAPATAIVSANRCGVFVYLSVEAKKLSYFRIVAAAEASKCIDMIFYLQRHRRTRVMYEKYQYSWYYESVKADNFETRVCLLCAIILAKCTRRDCACAYIFYCVGGQVIVLYVNRREYVVQYAYFWIRCSSLWNLFFFYGWFGLFFTVWFLFRV